VTLIAGTVGTSDSMRREVFVPAVTAAELVVEEFLERGCADPSGATGTRKTGRH